MQPTSEQTDAIELFGSGMNLAIQAGSGTGKTSTLQMLGESTARRGQYLVFNKAMSVDAGRRFPQNVRTNTVHSLAFRAVGSRYAHRLDAPRMRSMDIARILRVDPIVVEYDGKRKVLQPSFLGSLVMRSLVNFCYSAENEPGPEFVPYVAGIDTVDAVGRRSWYNNQIVRGHLAQAIQRAWTDLRDVDGKLSPYKHDVYLKIFQLSGPQLPVDFVLLDEAQDTNGVTLSLFEHQTHAQRILVGDDQQSIYSWRGSNINALQNATVDAVTFLSKSFRFGQEIADVANVILDRLQADLRLTGSDVDSRVDYAEKPDCILARTNAVAMRNVLRLLRDGRQVHLVGGGDELVRFARAVVELKETGSTFHPELACFTSYGELTDYVDQDPSGDELALLVKLVEEFSPEMIIDGLSRTSSEEMAEVVVSTAHRSKGREWSSVQLADDFPDTNEPEELRLLYVACTRAKHVLDVEHCEPMRKLLGTARAEPAPVVLLPS